MDESVKEHKKMKKHKSDQKQKKIISKDHLSSKVNTLEVIETKKKTDHNPSSKSIFSTELASNFHIPEILVSTHQKKDGTKNKVAPPPQKRKFSGDKTSQDCDQILENHDYTEQSEERRIRTKSLPQAPSHFAVNDFASAPLPTDTANKEKETATQELLNKRFSIVAKHDVASAPLCFHTTSKEGAKNLLTKNINTITLSEPISINCCETDILRPSVQVVDRTYVNNSPRQTLPQRSKSVTEPPKTEFHSPGEETGYLKQLYTSVKNTFTGKNKTQTQKEDGILHPQSQPQILSPSKQSGSLKPNAKLPNKTVPESKHNVTQHQKKAPLDVKSKIIDNSSGQKFAKLPTQFPVKTHESNIALPKHENNTSKLVNQKLPPATNLNKPTSQIAINHLNNSELDNLKIQLRQQQEQLNQLIIKQDKQQPIVTSYAQHNMVQQDKQQPTGGQHLQSNKGTALQTILQLVQATERPPVNLNSNLAGANHEEQTDLVSKYIYDQTDH